MKNLRAKSIAIAITVVLVMTMDVFAGHGYRNWTRWNYHRGAVHHKTAAERGAGRVTVSPYIAEANRIMDAMYRRHGIAAPPAPLRELPDPPIIILD